MYGCCPDGISPADGPNLENCKADSANQNGNLEDNDDDDDGSQSSVEPACESTEFGCCSDEFTAALGPLKEGCIDHSCRVRLIFIWPEQKRFFIFLLKDHFNLFKILKKNGSTI